jgi:CubicO group peptidase (beta-lactamase class C family)
MTASTRFAIVLIAGCALLPYARAQAPTPATARARVTALASALAQAPTLSSASASAPASASGQAATIADVLARWDHDGHPDLRSVLVLRKGEIIGERYYNGETADTLHDVRSAGKSITALLVGAAVDRGKIRSMSDTVAQYWPAATGSAIGDVTLDQVLTMRSGLAAFDEDPASPGNEDFLDEAADPLAFTLSIPRAAPPGSLYRYNSLTAYIAGLTVEMATSQKLDDFARSALFDPLGIKTIQWLPDVAGHPKGQGNLSLRTRDLGKIGQMVLGNGSYQGRQVISAAYVAAMLTPRVSIAAGDKYADNYGYFWYLKTLTINDRKIPIAFASGNGGNKIYVIPSLDCVVVVTSSAYGRGYGQLRSETILSSVLSEL